MGLVFRHFVSFNPNFIKPEPKKQPTFTLIVKKFLVSIIAVLYLGTSMGATVNLHYCMGRLTNWDLSIKETHTCENCGMVKSTSKKSGCCEDKHHLLQVEKDQKAESRYQPEAPVAIAVFTTYADFVTPVIASISEEHPVSNAPPRSKVPLHIRNCIFRI